MKLRFGGFVLDVAARHLSKAGHSVPLTPKAYELLECLVQRRPQALSKAQLHDRLWPSTFVSQVNLPALVNELRRALGDDARDPRFVRTVRGFGYAFCAPAVGEEPTRAPARRASRIERRILWEGHQVALDPGENLLGRTHEAKVWLEHPSVSRRHAVIHLSEQGAVLEDCGSKNGTWRSGQRIAGPTPLADGDRIRVGEVEVVFRVFLQRSTRTVRPG